MNNANTKWIAVTKVSNGWATFAVYAVSLQAALKQAKRFGIVVSLQPE